MIRPSAVARFFGVKTGEALADYLDGFITLDPLRALVPGRDFAVDIQQKNRVVFHTVD